MIPIGSSGLRISTARSASGVTELWDMYPIPLGTPTTAYCEVKFREIQAKNKPTKAVGCIISADLDVKTEIFAQFWWINVTRP